MRNIINEYYIVDENIKIQHEVECEGKAPLFIIK
jgi:hypothetical protein